MSASPLRHGAWLAAITAAAAVPVAAATAQLRPEVSAPVLALLGAITGLEAAASAPRARQLEPGSSLWLRFRAGELLLLGLMARAGTLLALPSGEIATTVSGWWRAPQTVVDATTLTTLAILIVLWTAATATANDLARAATTARSTAALEPLQRVTRRYLLGVVVVLAALGVHLRDPDAVLAGPPTAASVAYVVAGLVGITAVRRTRLEARWETESVAVAAEVGGAWRAHAAALVAGATLVALLIPTRTGFGGGLLVGALRAVERLVRSLTHRIDDTVRESERVDMEEGEALPPPDWLDRAEDPSAGPVTPTEPPAWVEATWPFVFWGVVALLATYLLTSYVRSRPELLGTLRGTRASRWLTALGRVWREWWRWIVAAGHRPGRGSGPGARRGTSPVHGPRRPGRRWPWPADRPRSRIVASYLELVEAAGRLGVPRDTSETPYEYEETLGQRLGAAHIELDRLTEAFVEARFSSHELDERLADLAVRDADRVEAAVRRLRDGSDGGPWVADRVPGR